MKKFFKQRSATNTVKHYKKTSRYPIGSLILFLAQALRNLNLYTHVLRIHFLFAKNY